MAEKELAILIIARDLASKTMNNVARAVSNVDKGSKHGATGLARFGTAAEHTKHSIGGLISSPLGLIGLGAGLLTLGGIFESTVGKMNDLAFATEKLVGISGLSAEKASTMIAVFGKFGLSSERTTNILGFMEKTLGKLNAQVDKKTGLTKLDKLTKQYGISLKDSKGHIVDVETEIRRLGDYFNGNASAAKKDALAATLAGRGYADLVPILKLGSKGYLEAAATAKSLGLVLTDQNANDLKKYREAMRGAGDAVGGLELQIGLALVPELTNLAHVAEKFVSGNGPQIIGFFREGEKTAEGLGHTLETTVVPAIQGIAGAWDKIPDDLKRLLIGGFVVNKLTGGLITGIAGDLAKGLIKGVLGLTAGVVNIRAGIVNGGGGLPGKLGGAAGAGEGVLAAEVGGMTLAGTVVAVSAIFAGSVAAGVVTAAALNAVGLKNSPAGSTQKIYEDNRRNPYAPQNGGGGVMNPDNGLYQSKAAAAAAADAATKLKMVADAAADDARETQTLAQVNRIYARDLTAQHHQRMMLWHKEHRALKGGLQLGALSGGNKALSLLTAAALASKVNFSSGPWYKEAKNQSRILGGLQALQKRFLSVGDTKSAKAIGADIRQVKSAIQHQKHTLQTITNVTITMDARKIAAELYKVNGRIVG